MSVVIPVVPGRPVLVLEDDVEVRHLLGRLLRSAGLDCAEAGTAADARALLEGGLRPAGILLDLRMPDGGGLAFLRHLRADARYRMLSVAITGDCFVDAATQAAVLALGASMTFKPLSKTDVVALAHRMIDAPSSPP